MGDGRRRPGVADRSDLGATLLEIEIKRIIGLARGDEHDACRLVPLLRAGIDASGDKPRGVNGRESLAGDNPDTDIEKARLDEFLLHRVDGIGGSDRGGRDVSYFDAVL